LGSSARRTPFCVKGVVTTYELGDLAANVRVESRWLVPKVIEQVIRADAYNVMGEFLNEPKPGVPNYAHVDRQEFL